MPGRVSRVAVVLHVLEGLPWSEGVRRSIESALQLHPEVRLEFADPKGDAAEQVRILDRFLAAKVDALILLPIDPLRTRAALRRYHQADIPVIVIDNDIGAPELYRSLILSDNRRIGQEAGELFAEVMGGSGYLVEIRGLIETPAAVDRSAGFREALASHPDLRIVDECIGSWLYERAVKEFSLVLARQPRIDGVFAQNDDMARGALDAAAQAGREKEMLVVGIDALPSAIRLVAEGRQAATFLNPSPGKDAVYALLAILEGEPCLPKTLLRTWPYQSNARIRAWQQARRR